MVMVYGYSDDNVEIEGSSYPDNEIGCFDSNVRINFADGTQILVGYPKEDKNLAVWWIKVEKEGAAKHSLDICMDEDADTYSDIFTIDSEVISHEVIDRD